MEYRSHDKPVSVESAEEQMLMLLDAYDIDMPGLKESNVEAFELLDSSFNNFVLNIRLGRLSVVQDNGETVIKQTLKRPIEKGKTTITEITYYPLTNLHVIAADKYDRKKEPTLRFNSFLGAISKAGPDVFNNMAKGADSNAANSVYGFFTLVE